MANEKRLIDANRLKRRMLAFATSIKRNFLSIDAIIDRIDTESTVDVMPKWISITERLPDEDTTVLTYRASGIEVESRRSNGWDYDDLTPYPVTYWMPTPEPPKEGKNA